MGLAPSPVMDPFLPYSPELIAGKVTGAGRRILLFGESGIGKSTLASDLAREFDRLGQPCSCISADPGSPTFGAPGAVCLGRLNNGAWQLLGLEALCSLDAGRFRLPLISAVRRLTGIAGPGMVLVDAPGIVRGIAGAELLTGLVRAAGIDTVLALVRTGKKPPLANELATSNCTVLTVTPSINAREPGKRKRAWQRTRLWDAYLQHAVPRTVRVAESLLTGTPPPLGAEQDWIGRQIALLKGGETLALGEILGTGPESFQIRIAGAGAVPDEFLVRDAHRNRLGLMSTFRPAGVPAANLSPPPDVIPCPGMEKSNGFRPVVRIGDATCVLANGVFGDPLLHLRLHNQKRSFLFDLGEGARLPARLAHQVSDVFISHAHIDHISGFLWLMRSRIGLLKSCRIFGPPGLSARILSLINGIHWDRIGGQGPRFEVFELHGDTLVEFGLQAGRENKEERGAQPAPEGILLEDPDCLARAVTLVHAGIPVLAYCLEFRPQYNVRKQILAERNMASGPWLGNLKKMIKAGDHGALIRLPDGSTCNAWNLAADLLQVTPARKLVYATDLSDTSENREKLTSLAKDAHTMFCEAAFSENDREHARSSGHLTGRACGEIARAAAAEQLVPFHFSRRYEKRMSVIHDEIKLYGKGVRVIGP